MSDDDFLRKIGIQTRAMADGMWVGLRNDDNITKVMEVAIHGPAPENYEFIQKVFALLFYELTQARGQATQDDLVDG